MPRRDRKVYNAFLEDCNRTATLKTPPDPENQNDARADWAQAALATFAEQTRSDFEDCLCDLLADLMHFADRHGLSFDVELDRARAHYDEEAPACSNCTPVDGIHAVFCQQAHPDTDEHRAACTSCMMAHDKALPDANSYVTTEDDPAAQRFV